MTQLDNDEVDLDSAGQDEADVMVNQLDNRPTQLALSWPDEVRGVPNAALRGALFSISQEREIYKKRQRIATVDGYEIRVKGERFNQKDLDLWEMLLHLYRQQPGQPHLEFRGSTLLQALERKTGGNDYEELKEDMARLMGTYVEILCTNVEGTFAGHLVKNIARHEGTQTYAVFFDEKILKLFDAGYTHVDWAQRRKLKKNSLAQWLHGFYSSHASPHGIKVATLKSLCGSTTERLTDFRKALKIALAKLEEIGAITSWAINPDTDIVTVRRRGSASQRRHLAKRGSQRKATGAGENAQLDFDQNNGF